MSSCDWNRLLTFSVGSIPPSLGLASFACYAYMRVLLGPDDMILTHYESRVHRGRQLDNNNNVVVVRIIRKLSLVDRWLIG